MCIVEEIQCRNAGYYSPKPDNAYFILPTLKHQRHVGLYFGEIFKLSKFLCLSSSACKLKIFKPQKMLDYLKTLSSQYVGFYTDFANIHYNSS